MGTGQSSFNGPTSSGKTLRCTGVPSTASPAISNDGSIFQPSTGGVLFAINGSLTSGALLWKFSPTSALSPNAASLTPVISEDGSLVYYAADNLYALNATTGAVVWTWNATITPGATFLTVLRAKGDGRVYVLVTGPFPPTQTGYGYPSLAALVALDGASGSVKWQRLGVLSDFSLSADGTVLYAASSGYGFNNNGVVSYINSALVYIAADSGELMSSLALGPPNSFVNAVAAPLVANDGSLIVITYGSQQPGVYLYNISLWNPSTRSQTWIVALNALVPPQYCPQAAVTFSLPTVVMDSTLLLSWSCQSAAGMLGLSVLNGAQVFVMNLPSFSPIAPNTNLPAPIAGADSTSYASGGGSVYGVNSGSGALLWAVNGTATAQVAYSAIGPNKLLVVGNCLYIEAQA